MMHNNTENSSGWKMNEETWRRIEKKYLQMEEEKDGVTEIKVTKNAVWVTGKIQGI
jgi:hypothetical protein